MRALARRLDHLGVWPALYAAAAVLAWTEWTGGGIAVPRGPTGAPRANPLAWFPASSPAFALAFALSFALLVGWSAFAIDRVKLRDRWLDPADRDAHPARFAFVAHHARAIRVAIAVAVAAATLIAVTALDAPILAALPAAAVIGTACYAPWPRGGTPRVKDRLLVKNLAVGAAFASFAAVVATLGLGVGLGVGLGIGAGTEAHTPDTAAAARLAAVTALLAIRVAADAALCDLDDAAADARHGTRTLATALGRRSALGIAVSARAACSVALVPLAATGFLGAGHAGVLAIAGVAGTALLAAVAARRPAWRIGPFVDASFAIEVAASAAVLSALPVPAS